jgi:hypothetical protein
MWGMPLMLVAVALVPAGAGATAAPTATVAAPQSGLVMEVLAAPRPVPGTDRRTHLVYEMLIRNDSDRPVRLERVQARHRIVLAELAGAAIERRMFSLVDGTPTRTLPAGGSALLLLDVTQDGRARPPQRIEHRFTVTVGTGGRPASFVAARTEVDRRAPVALHPPLHGSNLFVLGCCDVPFGHRLALFGIEGRLHLAQRYAIDFIRLDGELNSFAGDPARNESYFIYGDEVAAVGPGRVLAVRDGVPENTPPTPPANPGVNDLTGNFVLLQIDGGYFALYAHLQTGSLRVRPGDRVRPGQVLGQVGNTGNSTEPHLHFQVTDGAGLPSGLAANGVPYVFDNFRLDARVAGLDSDPPAPARVPAPPPNHRTGQYPLTGDIVGFGPAAGPA